MSMMNDNRLTPYAVCEAAPCRLEVYFDNGDTKVIDVKCASVDTYGYIHTVETDDGKMYDGRHFIWMKLVQ